MTTLICVVLAFAYAGSAHALEECFLQIDGVDGGSLEMHHRNAIDVTSYSWEEKNDLAASSGDRRGGQIGRAQMDYLHVSMPAGKASPALMLLVANNARSRQAVLECIGPGAGGLRSLIHRWILTDVTINSFRSALIPGQNNSASTDQIEMGFAKISYEYVPAAIKVEWDSNQNRGGFVNSGAAGQQSTARPAASSSR